MGEPPFPPDQDRTMFIPTPGRQQRTGAAPAPPPPPHPGRPPGQPPGQAPDEELRGAAVRRQRIADLGVAQPLPPIVGRSDNPLLASATVLFALAQNLRHRQRPRDVEAMRHQVIEAIKLMQAQARRLGGSSEQTATACFAMCALIDETVQHRTAWGVDSPWRDRNLLYTFYGEALAGNHVFELLRQALEYPHGNLHLLEFLYVCLCFGFEGRYRLEPNGMEDLARLKERVYQAIRRERGEIDPALSPHWQGVVDPAPQLLTWVPLWVTLAAAATLLLALFLFLNYRLGGQSEDVIARANAFMPGVLRPQEPRTPIARERDPLAELKSALAAEREAGLVEVKEFGNVGRLTLFNAGDALFRPGSATLGARFDPVLARASTLLAASPGPITVIGHTDNVPIHTTQFPSNWRLSQARADAVAARLAPLLPPGRRIETVGKGDTEAIEPNDTAAGRARNRRVEIRFPLPPAPGGAAASGG